MKTGDNVCDMIFSGSNDIDSFVECGMLEFDDDKPTVHVSGRFVEDDIVSVLLDILQDGGESWRQDIEIYVVGHKIFTVKKCKSD
jgi:hypothetical protein